MNTETPKNPKRKGDWLAVKAMAGMLGISQQACRETYVKSLDPADVCREHGKSTLIFAPAVVALVVRKAVDAASRGVDPDAALLAGADSPELERLRRAKRQREELNYAKDLAELESRAVLMDRWQGILAHCRTFAETQIRQHGAATAADWGETLDAIRQLITKLAPPGTRRRTLTIELETGETLTVPLSNGKNENERDEPTGQA